MAVGYLPNGEVASLTDLGWNRPCGQMYSTVEDLNRVSSSMFAHTVLHLVSFNLLCVSSWPCSSMRHTINHIFQSPVCLSHMYCQPCWGGKWAYLVRCLATTLLTVLYIATYAQGLSTLCTCAQLVSIQTFSLMCITTTVQQWWWQNRVWIKTSASSLPWSDVIAGTPCDLC